MSAENPIVDSPLVAHRGASLIAPENSLASVRLAAERGARWVETDVRITKDAGLVMVHDRTLDRTSNGSGAVVDATLDEIAALDGGSWFSADFADEPIPTLEAYLACILENGLSLQLELKENSGLEEALTEATIAVLRRVWPLDAGRLYLSSFSERCLHLCHSLIPEVPTAMATEFVPRDPVARMKETGASILHVQERRAGPAELAFLRETGIEFAVATVNDAQAARGFLEAGATSVLSDDPALLNDLDLVA